MGIIRGICISSRRGTAKGPVDSIRLVEGFGLEGDAHGGNWHRQVSLLGQEAIDAFNAQGAGVQPGDFGENLIVEGFDLRSLPVGTCFQIGDALLELTQIGKECHSHCEIFQRVGKCIMPTNGVFAQVLRGGVIHVGDEISLADNPDRRPTAAVITLSDKGACGQREDKSGPLAVQMAEAAGYRVVETLLLPDEQKRLERELCRLADGRQVALVLTTGGTGFSERDRTPEATLAVAERNAPGIAEAIRWYSLQITPRAMLGRGASVIRGRTLIVNLPGSPKAVRESLEFLLPSLGHGIDILRGTAAECAAPDGKEREK
ncbi:MAG: MOSC domain-containing protein [Clostridiales bacterium]|nr:MOSC domain-containing protein [Clostridiales bacterium]